MSFYSLRCHNKVEHAVLFPRPPVYSGSFFLYLMRKKVKAYKPYRLRVMLMTSVHCFRLTFRSFFFLYSRPTHLSSSLSSTYNLGPLSMHGSIKKLHVFSKLDLFEREKIVDDRLESTFVRVTQYSAFPSTFYGILITSVVLQRSAKNTSDKNSQFFQLFRSLSDGNTI